MGTKKARAKITRRAAIIDAIIFAAVVGIIAFYVGHNRAEFSICEDYYGVAQDVQPGVYQVIYYSFRGYDGLGIDVNTALIHHLPQKKCGHNSEKDDRVNYDHLINQEVVVPKKEADCFKIIE